MMSDVAPILPPDPDAMRRQLEHVFFGDLDGTHDGLLELAWNDPKTGSLSAAHLFGTDEIEELIERAAALNATPGSNVYIGAALRKPESGRGKRGADADFFAASCIWADVDNDVVGAAIAACKRRGVPPTMTVVTGRHPHLRAQLWWRLATPCRGPDLLRGLCSNIAKAIGGDPSVVNPGRVLRLGGSVAWPTKDGRVLERTEVHIPDDGRARQYFIEQLLRAFAPDAGPLLAAPAQPAKSDGENARVKSTAPPSPAPQPAPTPTWGGLAIGSMSVDQALAAIGRGDRWHDHAVRLVAHWISRGWSDSEILGQAAGLTLPKYTPDETRRDLARMIEGARRKWNVPNPAHELGDDNPQPQAKARWMECLGTAMIPPRSWLLGHSLLRGHLSIMVAPPGAGKSSLSIAQAIAVITGYEITGQTVHQIAKAWLWDNEDDFNELRRRLAAVLQYWNIPFEDVRNRIALNSGAERALMIARATKEGKALRTPDVDAIIEQVRADQVGLLIVDPFAEVHEVDENDNARMKAVAAMLREIAHRGNCAVLLIHHTSKPAAAASDAFAGNQNAARGASSLTGVARVVQTLFAMSERDAGKLGLDPKDRRRWVRLDDAKANLTLVDDSALWFKRVGVTIANGDEVGVLVPDDPKAFGDAVPSKYTEAAVLAEIDRAWRTGEPYSMAKQSKRFFGKLLPGRLGRAAQSVTAAIASLFEQGAVAEAEFDTRNSAKGLRVVPFGERRQPEPQSPSKPDGGQ